MVDITKLINRGVEIVHDPQIGLAEEITYHIQSFQFVSPLNGQPQQYDLNFVLRMPPADKMIPY